MKNLKTRLSILLIGLGSVAYSQEEFNVEIEPITVIGAPSLHSYAWGKTSDGKWITIGGRIDGLHERQPFAAFLESSNNQSVYIIDPENNQTWSSSLSSIPSLIFEQLQSTNQEFIQRENTLYVIGGYGFSASQGDHATFANLTAIDVDGLANSVINGVAINQNFRQITDSIFAVTGGQIGYLDSIFYLSGGQYFEGRYNPMGPDNGPGFIQKYTDEVRTFKLVDDGTTISVTDFAVQNDSINLHRRDYNMTPQIFPNGDKGFTMWSGVFDPNDLPYLNSVDVTEAGYLVNNSFSQYLSQYHSAKVPVYDSLNNVMHTLFFGGMSQYTLDVSGNLVQDDNVPFVKTISKVTRLSDGSLHETKLNIEMPTLLGAGAEFIHLDNTQYYNTDEILKINSIPMQRTLIGHIYGGIESTLPNIFDINDGTQSSASSQIFEVYINKSTVGQHELSLTGENIFNMKVFPNPTTDLISVEFFIPDNSPIEINIHTVKGELIKSISVQPIIGTHTKEIDIRHLSSGEYMISVNGSTSNSQKLIIKK